jgi:small conductance mechanosensitive channel
MNFLLETTSESINWSAVLDTVLSWCLNTGIKIIISLIVLFVSFRVINLIAKRILKKTGNNEKFDKTLVKTLTYVGKIAAKILVAICIVGYLGIDTSGLTALVTSLGVCAGLAVNGALSNLAGGVLIIFTRPFKVDDYIEVEGSSIAGTVEEIRIVSTKLRTPDNKVIYVPNGTLSNSNIINYSEKPTRRVDFTFCIAYESDFEKAREMIYNLLSSHQLALKDPEPVVRMSGHGDSSVDITARVWVNSDDYWTVKWDILEMSKKMFDENNIEIPYNKLDVNVKNV